MPVVNTPPWMDHWPRSQPHPAKAWTVSGEGRFGALEPESGRVWPVVPRRDRRLPGLAAALDEGATLVGYRVGRRAVLRSGDRWTKVVRPGRAAELAARHDFAFTAVALPTPEPIAITSDGRVVFTTVPGRALHEVIRREPASVSAWLPAVAAGLATLHHSDRFAPNRTPDTPERSLRIVERGEPEVLATFVAAAEDLPPREGGTPAMVHGDLHDKNILVADRHSSVGLIDLDGVGWGVAEDDVANLAVHLELRALQLGIATGPHEIRWFTELLDAYPRPLDVHRLEAARRHTYFRLAVLYRFRHPGRELSNELLRRATTTTVGR